MSENNRSRSSLHTNTSSAAHNSCNEELNNARTKFNDLLQDLVRHNKESASEQDCINSLLELPNQPLLPSNSTGPEKRSLAQSRSPRKRKKKDSGNNSNVHDNSNTIPSTPEGNKPPIHVIKLFDRSVDLAQFDERTSLYTLCRSWMHNNPNDGSDNDGFAKLDLDANEKANNDDTNGSNPAIDESGNVHSLPKPSILQKERYTALTQAPKPKLWDTNLIGSNQQSIEELKRVHIARWKLIRAKSRERLSRMQEQYSESNRIINKLYRPRH
ncbi:Protein lin-37-like protein [Trichoplax sp. H2]|nr:Protein lin-37-like protein [Trichoplax sp. H2]|eukprot:RDD39530.1 Protein lin-37-like protein [Trichoplax sp. H2]